MLTESCQELLICKAVVGYSIHKMDLQLSPVSPMKTTFTNNCYRYLHQAIIKGNLKPGQKLLIEQLKLQLAAGSSPIREALSRLVSLGLVEQEGGKGFRVAPIYEHKIKDLLHTFNQIENLALQQAIIYGDMHWEANIIASLYHLKEMGSSIRPTVFEQWMQYYSHFHFALITGCNSDCLVQIRNDLYLWFERYYRLSFYCQAEPLEINYQEYVALSKAVLGRDKIQAEKLLTKHILGCLEPMIRRLKLEYEL